MGRAIVSPRCRTTSARRQLPKEDLGARMRDGCPNMVDPRAGRCSYAPLFREGLVRVCIVRAAQVLSCCRGRGRIASAVALGRTAARTVVGVASTLTPSGNLTASLEGLSRFERPGLASLTSSRNQITLRWLLYRRWVDHIFELYSRDYPSPSSNCL